MNAKIVGGQEFLTKEKDFSCKVDNLCPGFDGAGHRLCGLKGDHYDNLCLYTYSHFFSVGDREKRMVVWSLQVRCLFVLVKGFTLDKFSSCCEMVVK